MAGALANKQIHFLRMKEVAQKYSMLYPLIYADKRDVNQFVLTKWIILVFIFAVSIKHTSHQAVCSQREYLLKFISSKNKSTSF